jgi:hypothetical protein
VIGIDTLYVEERERERERYRGISIAFVAPFLLIFSVDVVVDVVVVCVGVRVRACACACACHCVSIYSPAILAVAVVTFPSFLTHFISDFLIGCLPPSEQEQAPFTCGETANGSRQISTLAVAVEPQSSLPSSFAPPKL